MEIMTGTPSTLTRDVMVRLGQYRYRVFVERLGWDLSCQNGLEWDQFDRADTYYLVARRNGAVIGTARLLPTDRPYLLGEVFPQLMGGLPLPHSPDIWELSRFTAVDLAVVGAGDAMGQFSSPITVDLLRHALSFAAAHGVRRLITVSPLGIERLLRRYGFKAHRAAPPHIVDGNAIYACWIEVPPDADGRRSEAEVEAEAAIFGFQ